MAKTTLFASLLTLFAAISFAPAAHADNKCHRVEFKTEEVKAACAKGQKAAKDQMKAFMKKAKIKDCKACHSSLAPEYKLKEDGLKKYQDAGGK